MKFLLLLPLGMIVLSLARAPLMKGAVKTWGTVSVVICLGGCCPWGHCSGVQIFCTPSVLSHLGEVSQFLPRCPITSCSLRLQPALTVGVKSHCQCSSCLFPELLSIFVLQELCEAGRNPPPSTAVKVLICLSQEKPKLFILERSHTRRQ